MISEKSIFYMSRLSDAAKKYLKERGMSDATVKEFRLGWAAGDSWSEASDYFKSKKKYPDKLEELTPDYLIIIPLDPVTKGPYDYVPDEKFEKYTLSVKLSNGTNYSVNSEE